MLNPLRSAYRGARQIKRWLPVSDAVWQNLDLLKMMVQRDLSARYQGSLLGNLWPIANQVSQLLIYTYVFSVVLQVKLSLKGIASDSPMTFGLWLFAGLLPWMAFLTGLSQATLSVLSQPNLVKKVVFPLAILPLIPVFSAFIESTMGMATLIAFLILLLHKVSPVLWLLPLAWLPQLLLTVGLAYLTSGLTVFLRDIPQVLGVVLNLWFYATPIIYPVNLIPEPFQSWVFWLNPIAAIAEMYRDIFLIGEITHWGEWAIALVVSAITCLIGYSCYRRLRPAFADVL